MKNSVNITSYCYVDEFYFMEYKVVELKSWNEKKKKMTFHGKIAVDKLVKKYGNRKIVLATIYKPTGEMTIIIEDKEKKQYE